MATDQNRIGGLSRLRGSTAGVLALLLTLPMAGCGITYTALNVEESVEEGVEVRSMTSAEVSRANSLPFTPRPLPRSFFETTGAPSLLDGSMRVDPDLPNPPVIPPEPFRSLEFRPLPDTQPTVYKIGVGDVILLSTVGGASTVEQLSGLLAAQSRRQGYTVRDDGTIAIPEIGAIRLVDLTLQEAEDRIFDALITNQIDPTFTLEVSEFNSRRATIGGAVAQTTPIALGLRPVTLREAITAAGGITAQDAEYAVIRVYRGGTLYQISVAQYLSQPELGDALILNGDSIFVDTSYDLDRAERFYRAQLEAMQLEDRERREVLEILQIEIDARRSQLAEERALFEARLAQGAEGQDHVFLIGEIKNQGRVPLPFAQVASLADVLFESGGFNIATGDASEIYVVRSVGAQDVDPKVVAYHLDASNVANLVLATRFEMRPSDIVFVQEQPITRWNRALEQALPVLVRRIDSSI